MTTPCMHCGEPVEHREPKYRRAYPHRCRACRKKYLLLAKRLARRRERLAREKFASVEYRME
jgi:hypothetical protein